MTVGRWILAIGLLVCVGIGIFFAVPQLRNANPAKNAELPLPPDLKAASDKRVIQAVQEAWESAKRSPSSPDAAAKLGHVYMAHGWDDEAAICYARAADRDPQNYRWHYYLGRSRMGSQSEKAVAAFERSSQLNASYAPTHLFCGVSLRKLGKLDEAERAFQKAATLNPDDPLVQQSLGEIALERKQYDLARKYLTRAVTLNPGQTQAHTALARLFMLLGDSASAKQEAAEAAKPGQIAGMVDPLWNEVQNAGATADWHAVRGAVYLKEQQFSQALAELEQAVSKDQDDARFWLNYGICLLHFQRPQDAIDALKRSLAVRPSHREKKLTPELESQVHTNLGIATAQQGNLPEARTHFDAALKLDPLSIAANNNRAILLYKQGKLTEAIQQANALLAKRPNPETSQILQLLQAEQVKKPGKNR